MKTVEFYEKVRGIICKDDRYSPEAYEFINDAVIYTVNLVKKDEKAGLPRHITGLELINGIRDYAVRQFGPLAYEVLSDWGVSTPGSIGDIVFNMIESKLLSASERDSREDFNISYNLEESIIGMFMPDFSRKVKAPVIA